MAIKWLLLLLLFGSKLGFGQILVYFMERFVGAVFTCSAITMPKMKPIWMKFGALWVHCWGLALADFGCDPHSSDSL